MIMITIIHESEVASVGVLADPGKSIRSGKPQILVAGSYSYGPIPMDFYDAFPGYSYGPIGLYYEIRHDFYGFMVYLFL